MNHQLYWIKVDTGQKTLEGVIQKNISPGLDFIPSGGATGFTLSLIYGNRLREIIGGDEALGAPEIASTAPKEKPRGR
jgi:hypothetical protein